MTPSFFNTPEKLAVLRTAAESIVGTPFFANSEAPGRDGGFDCVRGINWTYRRCQVYNVLEIPRQVMDAGQHGERSALIEAFETWPVLRARFAKLPDCLPENILPGDTLCFLAGKVPHHGGLMITAREFLHTLKPAGMHLMPLGASIRGWKILGRLAAVYRPLPSEAWQNPPAALATAP